MHDWGAAIGLQSDRKDAGMALVINGERVEDAAIDQAREQLVQEVAGSRTPEWEARGISLERFSKDMVIAQKLVQQEAKRNGAAIPRKEVERALTELKKQHGGEERFQHYLREAGRSLEEVREDVELGMKVDRLLDEVCAGLAEPTEEELRAHYEAHAEDFAAPEQVHAAHIVKHVTGTILDVQAAFNDLKPILERLKGGADFAATASQFSDCPERGGDLGFFARGAMVPEFEEVVFALEEGAVSGIFQSPFGLHIAKVYARVPARPQPFEAVRDQVAQAVKAERENACIDKFTDGLRAQATVEEV